MPEYNLASNPAHNGWRRDSARNTLDILVGGVEHSKISGPSPLVYEDSTTQLYPLGTRLAVDERVYRYARAGAAINRHDAAMNNDGWSLTNEAPTVAAAVGATSITVVNGTATKNQYQGGWVAIFTGRLQVRRILANDISDGTNTVLYLDGGLEEGITASSTWVTGYPSIYYDTRTISEAYGSVVCVPNCVVASGSYYWGQTWGPCYLRAAGTVPGVTANDRDCYFAGTGALYGNIQAEGATAGGYQRAGFLLPKCSSGGGDQFFMLQLTP